MERMAKLQREVGPSAGWEFSKCGKSNRDFVCNNKMLINKNCKYRKNNKFRKWKDQQSYKGKEGPPEAVNLNSKYNKSKKDFVCNKRLLINKNPNTTRITNFRNGKTDKVTKAKRTPGR